MKDGLTSALLLGSSALATTQASLTASTAGSLAASGGIGVSAMTSTTTVGTLTTTALAAGPLIWFALPVAVGVGIWAYNRSRH